MEGGQRGIEEKSIFLSGQKVMRSYEKVEQLAFDRSKDASYRDEQESRVHGCSCR